MVGREGRKVLGISGLTSQKLEDRRTAEKSKLAFSDYVDQYLLINLEKDEFLSIHAPNIKKIGITDNVLYLKDTKKNKIVEIRMKNGKFECSEEDPIYMQYAWALPELSQLKKD